MDSSTKTPKLAASTDDTYNCTIIESKSRERNLLSTDIQLPARESPVLDDENESNYFKSATWSADGTSLLTSSADNTIRTFIIPPDLLSSPAPLSLTPYTSHHLPTSINCLAPSPYFTLQDPPTTLYLSTPTDLPIRLSNALSPTEKPVATYNLISPTTEAYLTPSSLLWSFPGSTFLAGTDCLIAAFDISRPFEGPVVRLPTIPSKRHKIKGGGVGMRGLVSALSLSPSASGVPDAEDAHSMLAAGTWTRSVGLYDMAGLGGTIATWTLPSSITGSGITQTLWSPCGTYLLIVERKSDSILVYDVRNTGKMVCWLEGRGAGTNQRLGVDVFSTDAGAEVWAGGMDGVVRIWQSVGHQEGAMERSWEWMAHDDPVTSTIVHSSGTVVATCSGQRSISVFENDEASVNKDTDDDRSSSSHPATQSSASDSSSHSSGGVSSVHSINSVKALRKTPDNSIKVWSL
ncbi:WD40-repeat-containing domain protein [Bisporella sp. PMI_857]|nr:WD40-repeat-containing domain protein [Bisporella sp. PMI_857]